MSNWIILPTQEGYQALGPIGRQMSRVLLYIVRKYNRGEMPQQAYTLAHELMTMAWRRVHDDPEFCEQMELNLQLKYAGDE